ncbi:MAG: hypothetical protein ACRC4L_00650, partial [Mycoplasma sp.]
DAVSISIKENDIQELIDAIANKLSTITNTSSQTLILQSERQINYVEKIIHILTDLEKLLKLNEPLDLLQSEFEKCIILFNNILGYSLEYDKLDELFKNFCLGK